MICPSCNKFAAYDTSNEPEVDLSVESELGSKTVFTEPGVGDEVEDPDKAVATITGTVHIYLTSECCGDELKEANFDLEQELEVTRAEGCTCDLTELDAEVDTAEITDRNEKKTTRPRYQKRFFGAQVNVTVSCSCGKTKESFDWQGDIQASAMDELV
jgi:hypothetical protein